MTQDPVCHTQVDEHKASSTSNYQGKQYAFCGEDCKRKFDQEPQRYAAAAQNPAKQQQGSHQQQQHK
jgi:YHS domain-containing protein